MKNNLLLILGILISLTVKSTPFYYDKFDRYNYIYNVNINGKDYRFTLDTGSDFTIIDSNIISRFGEPVKGEILSYFKNANLITSHGIESELNLYKPPTIKINAEKINLDVVLSYDLSHLSYATGQRIDGIIGLDVFINYIWSFDYVGGLISIYKDSGFSLDYNKCITYLSEKGDVIIPFLQHGNIIYFKLDTGKNGGLDITKDDKELIKFKLLGLSDESVDLLNNIRASDIIVISGFSFNNEKIMRMEGNFSQYAHRKLIGLGFLKRFDRFAIIPNEKLFCYDNFSTEDDPITLRKIRVGNFKDNEISLVYNDEVYLNSILLKNGDVIKELNGKQYEAKDIEQVREILSYAKKLKLVIRRGEQTLYRTIE